MSDEHSYALYASGNFIYEVRLDRVKDWLDPAVLSGERLLTHRDLTMYEAPLRIDASRSLFAVADGYVEGRAFTPSDADWRVGHMRLASDGTLDDALRLIEEFEEHDVELDQVEPSRHRAPVGEIVTAWEDPHGQWDVILVRL